VISEADLTTSPVGMRPATHMATAVSCWPLSTTSPPAPSFGCIWPGEVVSTYWYCWPTPTPSTSADQIPPASAASGTELDPPPGCASDTAAAVASGAHTRKVTPPGKGIDPRPGRVDGAVTTIDPPESLYHIDTISTATGTTRLRLDLGLVQGRQETAPGVRLSGHGLSGDYGAVPWQSPNAART